MIIQRETFYFQNYNCSQDNQDYHIILSLGLLIVVMLKDSKVEEITPLNETLLFIHFSQLWENHFERQEGNI